MTHVKAIDFLTAMLYYRIISHSVIFGTKGTKMARIGTEEFKWGKRHFFYGGLGTFVLIVLIILVTGGFGLNNAQDWQIIQSVTGKVTVRDEPGWYMKMFAHVWTYPRAVQHDFGGEKGHSEEGDPTNRVTFNDGGTAGLGTMIRFATPRTEELRLKAHREFSGSVDNMAAAVHAHMINCCKAAAPLMSSSEHQSARKAEFTQIVEDMLRNGIYEMRHIEKTFHDATDEKGNPITVFATEIIRDEKGQPKIGQVSPLKEYGFEVLQFSVTSTNYDKQTLERFSTKKESFQKAEQAKADREQEVQQRLMVVEKGKRQVAESEAAANVEKMTAVTNAQRQKEVATLEAQQKVSVADQAKKEAETKAQQVLAVAELEKKAAEVKVQTAEAEAKAIRVLAEAQAEKIAKGGAITEKERMIAEITAKRDIEVAAKLAAIQAPQTLMLGGSGGQQDWMGNLVSMWLMRSMGIVREPLAIVPVSVTPVASATK